MIRKRATKKKKMLAEQDNFNTNSTKETNMGLRLKKKGGLLCNQSPPRHQLSIKKIKKIKKKEKKKERQVENSSYTWMNCQRSKSFMYVKGGLAFRELSPN